MRLLPQAAGFAITSDLASVVNSPSRMASSPISNVSQPHIKMAGQDKLKIDLKYGDLNQRVLAIRNFFGELK